MKKIFTTALIILFPLFLLAQGGVTFLDGTITVGEEHQMVRSHDTRSVNRGNEIIRVKRFRPSTKDFFVLQKFDATSLKMLAMNEYEDFPKDSYIEGISRFKDNIYVFYSLYNKSSKQDILYCREVDFTNAKFKREVAVLRITGEVAGKSVTGSGHVFGTHAEDKYDFYTSSDSSKLLITYKFKPESRDKERHEQMGFEIFDNNMKKIWGEEVEMPYPDKDMDVLTYCLDSKTNIYIAAAVTRTFEDGSRGKQLELLRIPADTRKATALPLDIPGMSISALRLMEGHNETISCLGFFSRMESMPGRWGIFTFHVKAEGDIFDVKAHAVPIDMVKQNRGERYLKHLEKIEMDNDRDKKTTKYELDGFIFSEMIPQADSSALLICEQYKLWGGVYASKNILVAKLAKDNSLLWMKMMARSQANGVGLNSVSYKYIKHGNSHHILYWDREENFEINNIDEPKVHQYGTHGYLVAYRLDEEGNTDKAVLMHTKKNSTGELLFPYLDTLIPIDGDLTIGANNMKRKKEVMMRMRLPK